MIVWKESRAAQRFGGLDPFPSTYVPFTVSTYPGKHPFLPSGNAAKQETSFFDISGGVSQYHNETLTDFIRAADLRLYQAKDNGKNQVISDIY